MIVAVVPARGGSKRIPRKNILPFAGKPMIAHSIAAAQASGLFDRVIVSTEDEEVAQVARAHGAETPFTRPRELADDVTNTDAVLVHALDFLAERGTPASFVCCIYATAPFLTADDLRRGYDLLRKSSLRYTFAATSFPSRIQRALRIVPGEGVTPFFPQWIDARSQDLEEAYLDAGQFYWGDAEAFRQGVSFYAPHTGAILLPRHRVQDIDTPEDWDQAERLYRLLQEAT